MKARYAGGCRLCSTSINPGEIISKFLGEWAHETCKKAEIAALTAAAGPALEIPYEAPAEEPAEYVGTRHWRRRNKKFLKRGQPR